MKRVDWTCLKHLTPYLASWPKCNCYAAVSLHQWQASSCQSSLCCPALSHATDAGSNRLPQMPLKEFASISDEGMMHNGLASGSRILQLISICNISQLAQDRDQLEAGMTQHTVKGQQLTEIVGWEWMLTVSLQFQHSDSKIMNNEVAIERERERIGGSNRPMAFRFDLLKIITP